MAWRFDCGFDKLSVVWLSNGEMRREVKSSRDIWTNANEVFPKFQKGSLFTTTHPLPTNLPFLFIIIIIIITSQLPILHFRPFIHAQCYRRRYHRPSNLSRESIEEILKAELADG